MSNPFANWKPADVELHNSRVAMKTARQHNADSVGEIEVIRNHVGDVTEKRIPIAREADLHSQIFDECRRRGWIAFHGAMSERSHRTLGEPDFTIIADHRVLFVECKTRVSKLTREQQAMIAHAAKLGTTIHVVRSMVEFLKLL